MIYFKTLSLWVLALSVHNCCGFFNFRYKHLVVEDTVSRDDSSISTLWIDQPLDHFNSTETRSWKMRYFENLEFFGSGGPIVLFIGGENDAIKYWLKYSLMASFAKEVNGAMFMSEHRFYGESVPNDDMSTENLAYLSSKQALADIKTLLEFIKSQSKFKNSKVVVFGGGYAGNLAAWLRMLYPDLIDAALSSSAPVLAKTNFYESLEVLGSVFKKLGTQDCYNKLFKVFHRYEKLLKTTDGIQRLMREENICRGTDLYAPENQYIFFASKLLIYQKKVLDDDKYFIQTCGKHMVSDGFHHVWNKDSRCHSYDFNNTIAFIRIKWNWKAWIYQSCTEFGHMETTTSDDQPFAHHLPLDYYTKLCTTLFGPEFDQKRIDEGVKRTNDKYGGLTPRVEKVVFVHGDMDPWHVLGVVKDLSNEAPARVIPDASRCSDLKSDNKYDMPEMVAVRKFAKEKLKEWIGM